MNIDISIHDGELTRYGFTYKFFAQWEVDTGEWTEADSLESALEDHLGDALIIRSRDTCSGHTCEPLKTARWAAVYDAFDPISSHRFYFRADDIALVNSIVIEHKLTYAE